MASTKDTDLDDVALLRHGPDMAFALDDVGLENVHSVVTSDGQRLNATVAASVSLRDPAAKGIHMSRIYKIVSRLGERELTWDWLHGCLDEMLSSHSDLSDGGRLEVAFDLPVLRTALLSIEQGWRAYPLTYSARAQGPRRESRLKLKVLYSSTCPCSAALSQQALRESFAAEFREDHVSREQILNWLSSPDSLVATAHAQRSEAVCDLVFTAGTVPAAPLEFIDLMERALGTPVQTAVKREDEQEFARLNAHNLMFCEDAARKLKSALKARTDLADFCIEVRHFESLHAHDVVARVGRD